MELFDYIIDIYETEGAFIKYIEGMLNTAYSFKKVEEILFKSNIPIHSVDNPHFEGHLKCLINKGIYKIYRSGFNFRTYYINIGESKEVWYLLN